MMHKVMRVQLVLDGPTRQARRRRGHTAGRVAAPGGGGVTLPGGLRLRAAERVAVPDGWTFTGAAQIKDTTLKVTRQTLPRHRRYVALISLKADDPVPSEPHSIDDIVGVDVGVAVAVCTSDGGFHTMPDETANTAQIKRSQRARNRCGRGSRRWKKHARRTKTLNRRHSAPVLGSGGRDCRRKTVRAWGTRPHGPATAGGQGRHEQLPQGRH